MFVRVTLFRMQYNFRKLIIHACTRYVTLSQSRESCSVLLFMVPFDFYSHTVRCLSLPEIVNGVITYIPPLGVSSDVLLTGQRFVGTIATYSCSPGYQLVGRSSLRGCVPDQTWNETMPSCEGKHCTH